MSNWKLSRRHLLTTTGAALLLPFLESAMGRKAKAATPDPRRFISLYMPNGTYNKPGNQMWYPTAAGALSAANAPPALSPFASSFGDFSVMMGLTNKTRDATSAGGTGDHLAGISTYLTGKGPTDRTASTSTVPGNSFDQAYALVSGKPAYVMSMGCDTGAIETANGVKFNYEDKVSYSNGMAVAPSVDPVTLFAKLAMQIAPSTGTGTGTTPPPQSAPVRNRSILDNTVAQTTALQAKLGSTDKQRLQAYLDGVRALETQLGVGATTPPPPMMTQGCVAGTPPSSALASSQANIQGVSHDYVARATAFMDIITLAVQCDLSRSMVFLFDAEGADREFLGQVPSNLVYQQGTLDTQGNHIGISHYSDDSAAQFCVTRDRFYLSYFVYLINALKASKDPSGASALDNTVIMSGHSVIDGDHNWGNTSGMCTVLGGGAAFMHPGKAYALSQYDHLDLLYTLSQFMGMGMTAFPAGSSYNHMLTI